LNSPQPTTTSISSLALTITSIKHTKLTGLKKERQTADLVKASTMKKAKDAVKKAVKKALKKPNKENVTSSTATAQLHAKQSQQKSQGTSREHSPSPDINALKA
jgi:fatty acid-binding protein DegV